MGKALYRQYRSTSFDEVIGQDHITTTLKNSIANGSTAHAYLLTGPRGVGKTSVARIMALAVNGLPYDKEGSHLDIIEIDAASNRRIDEIRELRERVQIAPTSAKYKVYIIDEVHMLTREAFNALLKTLEEPPAHAIFILATTDLHKVPDTIVSRCITFVFRPISTRQVAAHLKHIAKQEKLDIADDALELLANHGEGSFRDSISLLDQIKDIATGKIDRPAIEASLGLAPEETVQGIINAMVSGNAKSLAASLDKAFEVGANEANLARQLGEYLREGMVSDDKFALPSAAAVRLLEKLLDVAGSPKPRIKLELSLLETLFSLRNEDSSPTTQTLPDTPKAEEPAADIKITAKPAIEEKKAAKKNKTETATATLHIDKELWDEILQKLKTRNNTLYGITRMARADIKDDKLTLNFKFPFHFKQVNQPKNKSIIAAVLEELGHQKLIIEVALETKEADKAISNINNIFGESEVLES